MTLGGDCMVKRITSMLIVLMMALMALSVGDTAAAPGMDTDLGDSDASFLGEGADDGSGWSVAGVGDINGDGYDDILIGAPGDDDGGSNAAGQTYLIFGNASGWSMDTDLSNADASFWGEDAGDFSGWTVAGAGDVNSDGYTRRRSFAKRRRDLRRGHRARHGPLGHRRASPARADDAVALAERAVAAMKKKRR